jgi:hypothetical protein
MKRGLLSIIILIGLIILGGTLFFNLNFVSAAGENATMIVEVNLVGFGETMAEGVGIEVPDFITLENLTKNKMVSEEITLKINNTGSVPITVTPQLKNPNEDIFSYLFFRLYKQSGDPDLNLFYQIGDYSVDIDKPLTGSRARTKSFYMQLNLTNYPEVIDQDIFGHQAEIIFYAMAQ